jgi:ABC-2 type transport system ATP-binding protein
MLTIDNISFGYRKDPVISDFSLSLEKGTICGLLGPNGTGKTTLLYLISGLLKADKGTVNYNGFTPLKRDVEFLSDIFIVPEEFRLPSCTLKDYVDVNSKFYPNFSMEDMREYLTTFELPDDIHLGRLSMGQKKKVFISFALACNTSLLLLDEPTNGLDIPGKRLFRQALVKSMSDEKTVIISTHQVYDIDKVIDHIVIAYQHGVLLNESTRDVAQKLAFSFTTDRERIAAATLALEAPGGYNIVEPLTDPEMETDINLETLFELSIKNPQLIASLFPQNK